MPIHNDRRALMPVAASILLAAGWAVSALLLPFPQSFLHAMLLAALLHIAWTDLTRYRIHLWAIGAVFALGVVSAGYQSYIQGEPAAGVWYQSEIVAALLRAAGFSLFLYLLNEAYRKYRGIVGIASGDILLFGASATWLPLQNIPSLVLTACIGALVLVLLRGFRTSRTMSAGSRVPLGAFIAVSLWLSVLQVQMA